MDCSSPSALCGVCLSSFRDARVLPCLHSLCKDCVDQLAVTATDGQIQCPICRWTFHLPLGGAAALPTDVTAPVIDAEGSNEEWLKCASCGDDEAGKKPSTWCKNCLLAFCDTHATVHILSATSRGEIHLGVPHNMARADRCTGFSRLSDEVPLCAQHNEPLLYHCGSCDVSICGRCGMIGDHQGHKPVRKIKDIVQERKRQVGKKVEKLDSDVVKTVERSLTDVENVSTELSRRADQVRAEISQAEKKAVNMIKAHARQMIQDVDDMEQSRHKVLDNQHDELKALLDAARGASRFSGRVLELETTREDILFSLLESLETRTTGLLSTHINEQPQSHSRLMFEGASDAVVACKTKECIGKVFPCETSAKHSEIEGDTARVVKKDEEMIVTVRAKDGNGQYLCIGGEAISTKCRGEGLSAVSINDNGDGSYALLCVCSSVGSYELEVYINGEKMANDLTITCVSGFTFDPNERHLPISVSEDKRTAILKKEVGRCVSILGSTPMRHGEYTWKLKIGSVSLRLMLGVAAKPLPSYMNDYNTAYCWTPGGSIYYRGGVQCPDLGVQFSANDTLQLHLDCARHILQITNLCSGKSSMLTNLPDKEFFQYVGLQDRESSAEFVE